ncbi:UNVERIFIED_ORG: hypothetical protein ABIC34_003865 [Sphingomonas sp. 1057]
MRVLETVSAWLSAWSALGGAFRATITPEGKWTSVTTWPPKQGRLSAVQRLQAKDLQRGEPDWHLAAEVLGEVGAPVPAVWDTVH